MKKKYYKVSYRVKILYQFANNPLPIYRRFVRGKRKLSAKTHLGCSSARSNYKKKFLKHSRPFLGRATAYPTEAFIEPDGRPCTDQTTSLEDLTLHCRRAFSSFCTLDRGVQSPFVKRRLTKRIVHDLFASLERAGLPFLSFCFFFFQRFDICYRISGRMT